YLTNNKITNVGQDVFGSLPRLSSLDMSGSNQLQCDCNVYNSLVAVISSLNSARAAVCAGPSRVVGAKFYPGGSYEAVYRQAFTCCNNVIIAIIINNVIVIIINNVIIVIIINNNSVIIVIIINNVIIVIIIIIINKSNVIIVIIINNVIIVIIINNVIIVIIINNNNKVIIVIINNNNNVIIVIIIIIITNVFIVIIIIITNVFIVIIIIIANVFIFIIIIITNVFIVIIIIITNVFIVIIIIITNVFISDKVKAGTDYTCYVQMTVLAYNGTVEVGVPLGILITRTTPRSEEASLTTVEGNAPSTNTTMNPSYFYLNVTYYDFRFSDTDFVGLNYRNAFKDPTYIASPYGSWLAISVTPKTDSFSSWFRSDPSRNKPYDDILELKNTSDVDSNGAAVYRYYEPKFFPVDGKGFGAEGQRDCYTNALRNYGFTTVVKGTFTFTGNEEFAFAGGEELWVFVNRKRVVQLFHDPSVPATPCRTFSLKPAANKG
ncbi:hypothetical protein QZH41_010089, partial [Actinostola sp. cb2023]